MRILYFAQLQDVTGCAEEVLAWGEVDAAGLWHKLLARHPGLAPFRSSVRLARNAEYADPNTRFTDGDEVALIPPVSGG
jgi:molybdopterin converting factor subunit 1